jgi:hypothetical protein
MKNLLKNALACAVVMSLFVNCTVESVETMNSELLKQSTPTLFEVLTVCVDQDPQASITNNGTIPVTFEILTLDGTILHTIPNIAPGNSSGYLTFAPDEIVFNISKNTTGLQDDKIVFVMNQCMSFDLELGATNYLVAGTPYAL